METIEEIKRVINEYKPDNREITNNTYATKVADITKNGIDPVDFKKVREFLQNTNKSYKTIRSYYVSILVYLKAKGLPYIDYIITQRKMATKIEADDKTNEATPEEKKSMVSENDYIRIISHMELLIKNHPDKKSVEHHTLVQDLLIVNLYYLIPPVRNNYIDTVIVSDIPDIMDPDKNYFCRNSKTLVLNRYKTDKVYGSIFIDIPDPIIKLTTTLINKRKKLSCVAKTKDKPLLLFKNRQNVLQQKGSMKQTLNRIFGNNTSVTALRKSYISGKYSNQFSIAQMEADAEVMGHSLQQQQSTYRKIL